MSVISTTTSVNGIRLAHHISEARMATYHFYCFFRNNAWWRPFRESLKKIYRELFLLRNHLKDMLVKAKGFYQHNGHTAGVAQVCQPHFTYLGVEVIVVGFISHFMVLYFRNVDLDLPKISELFWTPVLSRYGNENLTSWKNHLVHLWPTSFIQANYVQLPQQNFSRTPLWKEIHMDN